jgi:hypothetical protein
MAVDMDQFGALTAIYNTGGSAYFDDHWLDDNILWQQGDLIPAGGS